MTPSTSPESDETIRVLHVDDESEHLRFTKVFLEEAEPILEVESVNQAYQVLSMLKTKNYDCIVSDFKMPDLTGIELARKIKASHDIPFILYTGQGSEEVAETAFQVGIDDYMRKELQQAHYQVLARRIRRIVEQKRTDKQLLNATQELQEMINKSSDAIFRVEIGKGITRSNQAFQDIFGFTMKEEVNEQGLKFSDLLGEEDKAVFKQEMARLMTRKSERYLSVYQLFTKKGEKKWIESSITPIIEGDVFIGVDVIARDVTERMRMEYELKESERKYRELFENLIEGVAYHKIILNEDGEPCNYEFIDVNRAFESLTGLKGSEIIGKRVTEVLPEIENDPIDWIGRYGKVALEGGEIKFEQYAEPLKMWYSVTAYSPRKEYFVTIFENITESKKTEEALKNRDELLSGFMDSATDGFSIFDKDMNYLEINKALEQRAGRKKEEFIGKNILEMLPNLKKTGRYQQYLDVIKTGIPLYIEGAQASEKNQYLSIRAFKVGEGLGIITTDLTEQKRIEKEISEREEQYKNILESSRDAIFVVDETRYLYANKSGAQLLGYLDPSELIGSDSFKHIPPEDRESIRKNMILRQKGEPVSPQYILTLQTKNGDQIKVESSVSTINFEGKKASLAINREIGTQQIFKQKLMALHSSTAKLVLAKNIEDVYNTLTETVFDVLGFPFAGVAKMGDEGYVYNNRLGVDIPPDWVIPFDAKSVIGRTFKTGKSQLVSDTRKDPDYLLPPEDQNLPQSLSELTIPIIIDGKVETVLNMEHANTDAFSDLDKTLMEILSQHVSLAINRLRHNEEIKRTQKESLEQLMDGIDRVSSMVRHDFRGPLRSILNATTLIKESPENTEEMLEIISRNVDYAANMLEDLRYLTKQRKLNKELVQINELIETVLRETIIPDNIIVNRDLSTENNSLNLDRVQMRRVIDNLIRNAVEAMPDGGELTVKSIKETGHVVFSIKDTGHGIETKVKERMFQPFTTTKPTGMGLGLSHSKQTIEAHQGTISYNSVQGKGTTFTVRLPLKEK